MRFHNRCLRALVPAILTIGLAGCSFTGSADVSGSTATTGPTASAAERQHQDAQVVSNVLRGDLTPLSSLGTTCESGGGRGGCPAAVQTARGASQQAVADLQVLRVPASMKPDTQALLAALQRTLASCDPVLNLTGDRIAEAYATNEFDTAVEHVVTALSKVEGDAG